jgi:hypothetical protein
VPPAQQRDPTAACQATLFQHTTSWASGSLEEHRFDPRVDWGQPDNDPVAPLLIRIEPLRTTA